MKKTLVVCGVLIGFLALAVSPAAAQITGKGAKLGLSLANMSGDDIEENDAKLGFALGGFVTYSISEAFSVQPELLFVQKGTKWSEGDAKLVFRLSYLELPILAKYSFAAGPNMKVFVFGGPAIAFKIGATSYFEWEGESETDDIEDMKALDLGLAFGAGIQMPFNNLLLSLDARYTLGLTDCFEEIDGETVSVKNGAFLILAGIGF